MIKMKTSNIVNQPGEFGAQVSPGYEADSGAREEGSIFNFEPLEFPSNVKSLLCKAKALPPVTPGHQPTLAIDLDGTLANTPPHAGDKPLEGTSPKPGAIEAVQRFYKNGWIIVIWTCRSDKEEIADWLKHHQIPFHYINENPHAPPTSSPKIICDYYIDDRSIRPDSWPSVVKEIEEVSVARQPVSYNAGYQALAGLGEKTRPELQQVLEQTLGFPITELVEEMDISEPLGQQGGVVVLAPNKGEERATEKVNTDYGGDWSRLLDMVRAAVAVDSWDELRQAVEKLDNAGLILARNPKNRFAKPNASGYRDFLVNYRLPNGMIVEVQFHLKPILLARERVKQAYNVVRKIRANMKEEERDSMTPKEIEAVEKLREQSKKIFQETWNQVQKLERGKKREKQMPFQLQPFQGTPPEEPPQVPPSPYMFIWHKELDDFLWKASPAAQRIAKMPKPSTGNQPFTGIIRDSLGRKYCIYNGKRVPCPKEDTKKKGPKSTTGSGSGKRREGGRGGQSNRTGRKPGQIQPQGGSGSRVMSYFAIVFNNEGKILENASDKEYGSFIWSFQLSLQDNPIQTIQQQLSQRLGQTNPIGEVGEAKNGQGYFLFSLVSGQK